MTIQGTITDRATGKPIPGVSVVVEFEKGGSTGIGTTTNAQGKFYIDHALASYPQVLAISHVSFKPAWYLLEDYNEEVDFSLAHSVTELPNVVVSSKKKSNLPLIAGAGLLLFAAVQDEKKKKVGKITSEDARTGVTIALGIAGIIALKKILEKLSILDGPGAGAVKDELTNPHSPWKPTFLTAIPPGTEYLVLTDAFADKYTKIIHDAFTVFQDNYNEILGVFSSLRSQSQVSYLAKKFQERYKMDLLTFLTDGGGILPWDGLSDKHLLTLTEMVKNLPKYK